MRGGPLAREGARIVGFAALVAAGRPSSWRRPLARDAAQYLYVGRTILRGGRPYLDAANNKGPLLHLLFALIRLAAGRRAAAVRATLVAPTALACWALAGWVERLLDRAAGTAAGAALAVLSSAESFEGDEPNAEHYALPPLVAAASLAARPDPSAAAVSGALASSAVLITPASAVLLPIVAVELGRTGERPARARYLAAAGGAATVAVGVLGWTGRGGGLAEMFDQVVASGARNVKPERALDPGRGGRRHLLDVPGHVLWATGLGGSAAALAGGPARRMATPAAAWALAVWARTRLFAYAFGHHYYLALPGLAAGIAAGGSSVRPRTGWARLLALLLAPAAWTEVVVPQLRASASKPWDRAGEDSPFALAYPVARFVADHTGSDDRILVAASHPAVYWLADRSAPTRFFDVFPLWRRPANADERRRDVLGDPPKAVAAMPGEPLDADIEELLAARPYRLAWSFRGARVWLLE